MINYVGEVLRGELRIYGRIFRAKQKNCSWKSITDKFGLKK